MKKKINYKIAELPMWDLTLAEIFKVDKNHRTWKMTLMVEEELYRISIPKMDEWKNIKQDDKILVTVDKSESGKYGKLYNMSERTEAKVNISGVHPLVLS